MTWTPGVSEVTSASPVTSITTGVTGGTVGSWGFPFFSSLTLYLLYLYPDLQRRASADRTVCLNEDVAQRARRHRRVGDEALG